MLQITISNLKVRDVNVPYPCLLSLKWSVRGVAWPAQQTLHHSHLSLSYWTQKAFMVVGSTMYVLHSVSQQTELLKPNIYRYCCPGWKRIRRWVKCFILICVVTRNISLVKLISNFEQLWKLPGNFANFFRLVIRDVEQKRNAIIKATTLQFPLLDGNVETQSFQDQKVIGQLEQVKIYLISFSEQQVKVVFLILLLNSEHLFFIGRGSGKGQTLLEKKWETKSEVPGF